VGAFYPERDMEAPPRILERRVITVTDQDMPRLGIVDLGAGADADLVSDAGMFPALVVDVGVGVGEKFKATNNSNVYQR
jgi:hypothetical protein